MGENRGWFGRKLHRLTCDESVLEAEIYDGTGSVTAIFLGRRRICGIETGKNMVLRGRITEREGQSIIYNPRYELLCARSPAA